MKKLYGRFLVIVLISVMLFFCILTVEARVANISYGDIKSLPQQEVRGVVSDQPGLPLPGVTVAVKGKNRGTTTNIDGEYAIAIEPGDTLIFSFVGFHTLEEPVDGRREIMVRLEDDISSLGEVQINAGYYNTTRRESTGNISRVTAEEIELQPVVSPLQSLQGRMAGVEIVPGGSHPGMAPTIRIRGTNSLRPEGNLPLYIIDGVPISSTPVESNSVLGNPGPGMDPLNTLNLSNIESIEVLKDADATAIYGSRGANGVVLITTKSGKRMGTGLETSFYTGVATFPNRLNLLNTSGYLRIRRQALENDNVEPTPLNAYDLVSWDQERQTDWQDLLFGGTTKTSNANVNFAGGNEYTSFRIGGSYFTQGTIYPGDYDYNKMTGDFNLNHRSEDSKLRINLSLNYGLDVNNLIGFNGLLSSTTLLLPPNAPTVFNEDGSLHWEEWGEAGLDNPLAGYFNNSVTETNNFLSNLSISFQIVGGLEARLNTGYSYFNSQELLKRPRKSYNPASSVQNNSFHMRSKRKSWIMEPQLVFNENFGYLNLETIVGGTFQNNTGNKLRLQGQGYVAEALVGNLDAAEVIMNASSQTTEYKYAAVFARVGTNWQKKYFINLTGRRDGSSRFGPGNRFSNFGAIGTAWIFTEEAFVSKTLPFLSFGKLRGSYGTTGNDQIGDYGYLEAYEATPGPGGLYPVALANPDYSWEVNKKLEAAVELGLARDRILVDLSWYRNRSSNQLVGYPLPSITGFSTVQANLPATVQNSGWEIGISSQNINTANFQWRTSFNISFPRNELISYPGIEQSSYANTYRVGHPLNISLLYQYTGIDPDTGLYSIADINEDGRFDYEDRVFIRDLTREFFGGINNTVSYKNLSLQFLWEFVKQDGDLYFFNAGRYGNQRDVVLGALNGNENLQAVSQTFQANTAYNNALSSNLPIQDASFFRLKTLTLNYNLPGILTEKIGLNSGKLFLNGHNLATITSYEGLDPESPQGGTAFNSLRTVAAGLQLNF